MNPDIVASVLFVYSGGVVLIAWVAWRFFPHVSRGARVKLYGKALVWPIFVFMANVEGGVWLMRWARRRAAGAYTPFRK